MSEKESKTTENPDIAQTDVAVPLQPESASTVEFQQDEEFASEVKEPAQMENECKQNAGRIQHEAYIVDQSRNETNKDESESYSDGSTPALEKSESDVLTSPNSALDANSISEPSKVSYDKIIARDKISDTSESPNCSKRRNENRDDFVIQAERMLVDEVSKSDIQNLSDTNQDESKITVSFRILEPLSKMESETYENKDISPAPVKENQSLPAPITVEFRTEVPTGKDNDQITRRKEYISSCSRCEKLPMKSDDENTNESKLEHQDDFETGRVMNMSPVAQRKGESNVPPCNTQESERDRRSMVVTYTTKSTGFNQQGNERTGQFENQGIFEASGSRNPRLKRFRGIVYTGGDEIEYLSEESSEPEIFTTPSSPVELEPPSTESLESVYILELLGCLLRTLGRQMAKAPLFYCISIVAIIISMIVLVWRIEDYDIYVSIIFSFLSCIVITLVVDRGEWAKTVDEMKEECCSASCAKRCKKLCICGACCGREPQKERHSQYYHLEQEQDTAFKHEIADVSNIDPEDYPHMKFVDEQEITEAESPDYPTDLSPVNVYGHASGNCEEFAAINENSSQVIFKKDAESHHKMKSKSSSAPLKLPKSYEAEIRIQESGENYEISDFHEAKESKSRLKTHDEALPKPVKIGFEEERDVENEHNREEFICEHTGKSIACSCSLYAQRE